MILGSLLLAALLVVPAPAQEEGALPGEQVAVRSTL